MEKVFEGVHILVVEANDNIREILVDIFRRRGFIVLEAKDCNDALKKVEGQDKPDIIIIDVISPDLDGVEICERLKSNISTSKAPIIFYSTQRDFIIDFTRNMPGTPVNYYGEACDVMSLFERIKKLINKQ